MTFSAEAIDQEAMEGGESRYSGMRHRSWGKWVMEVRVLGTRERLWLGSYSTPKATAMANDTVVFYLKGPSSTRSLNFPVPLLHGAWAEMSPRSIQQVACETGMAIDIEPVSRMPLENAPTGYRVEAVAWRKDDSAYNMYTRAESREEAALDISVEDMEIYL